MPEATDSPSAPPEAQPAGALGILGGSGLYDLPGLEDAEEVDLSTPFGLPSDRPVTARIGGTRVVFIPRHGRGHRLLPSEINYRANVHALKQLGVDRVLSVSAVGSLREGIAPGDFVVVDQFIDRTHLRRSTFFGDGCAGHVSFADPVCARFSGQVVDAATRSGFVPTDGAAAAPAPFARGQAAAPLVHRGGTYVCMEGPQFSTRAESHLHRSWGASIIGMTGATEAKLCREAELCFALLALSTDYDCWHPELESVTASAVLEVLASNIARAQELVRETARTAPGAPGGCRCSTAAQHAIMTSPAALAPAARERLQRLYGRYIGERNE